MVFGGSHNCRRLKLPMNVQDLSGISSGPINYFSSRTISIAFFGHSLAQIPQPLQNRRSTLRSSSIAASGQYMAQSPQALHLSRSTTCLNTRHDGVRPGCFEHVPQCQRVTAPCACGRAFEHVFFFGDFGDGNQTPAVITDESARRVRSSKDNDRFKIPKKDLSAPLFVW